MDCSHHPLCHVGSTDDPHAPPCIFEWRLSRGETFSLPNDCRNFLESVWASQVITARMTEMNLVRARLDHEKNHVALGFGISDSVQPTFSQTRSWSLRYGSMTTGALAFSISRPMTIPRGLFKKLRISWKRLVWKSYWRREFIFILALLLCLTCVVAHCQGR